MTASKDPTKKKPKEAQQDEEFVDVSPPQRNWKGIAISLLVIVVVCSLITMSVVVLTPAELPGSSQSRLTVADLYKPEFSVHDPEATWISDSEVVYRSRDGHVIKFNMASNDTQVILTNSTFVAFKVVKYSLSADQKYALFAYDVKQMYRYSYTASYIVYNIYTREVWELNPPEVHNAVLQHAAWGRQGQQLIYIFENNIYYQADVRSNSLRITSSGMEGVVFNGLADWLYEEEILRSHLAHWWSPDGERLAFLTINDTLVPNMVLPQFTGSSYPRGQQYPYPMAGQRNPVVRLSVVNLFGATHTQELQPPDGLRDFYVTMVTWVSNIHLAVRWVNRPQNASLLTVCDATIGACLQRHEDSSETWLSMQRQEPRFSKDRSRFFLSLPVKQGGQGEFHHITMFTKKLRSDKDEIRHLTSGDWEVTRIVAYDEKDHVIFYLSTEESAQQRHLYSVSTHGLFPRRCLTCGLKAECLFFEADVSPDAQHAILHCRGPGVPAVLLLSFDDVDSYFVLENNLPLRSALESKKRIQTEIRMMARDNFELPLKLVYPTDFSESRLYGLLLAVGSSPGDQAVTEQFGLEWDAVLVGSEQVIVARLDGRGSGFRGQRVLQQVHGRLGTVDAEDQIAALEYLAKLPFIDRTRVGVFGEDYGGFLTLTMLKTTEKLIRCAAAQAPVTDWSTYASAFSERYLGSPATEDSVYQNLPHGGCHELQRWDQETQRRQSSRLTRTRVFMEPARRAPASLERLPFNNTALKRLPVDDSRESASRTVPAACFSRIASLQPLVRPSVVALSRSALALLDLRAQDVSSDRRAPEYLSGSRLLPGSEPAAHCYCGHQFGVFAGQLGDGAAMYLGEVESGTHGRWEIQVKGAGVTPYSRGGDGRKVLRSSIREFLCSEAMAALGIPSTRAASLVTSDLYVSRDPLNSGRRIPERCSVVLRLAPSFIRFGSFEIFLGRDDFSGLQGPSAGRHDLRAQLLDYVIETFYPRIQETHSNRRDRNLAFFREVMMRTAKLVAQWQCVGFCHGVLNTDNMSILGVTLDYGPFGFMDRFDPDFVCNASDKRGRYSYRAQPSVCRWNLARLAEALGSELDVAEAGGVLDEFTPTYEAFYLGIMRRKLGLVKEDEAEDSELISDLLRLMHNSGADFTNTFRLLNGVPWPEEGDIERAAVGPVVDLILEQCASIEELKVANEPTMEDRELAMILSMAQSNPAMFGMVADRPAVSRQLERMGRLKELLETDQDELKEKQRGDWIHWLSSYRRRLAREFDGTGDLSLIKKERLRVMDSTNPYVVLRNYIAQNAILAAEKGDFSEVNRVLRVLEDPYSDAVRSEPLDGPNACGEKEQNGREHPYNNKPPAWAQRICIT